MKPTHSRFLVLILTLLSLCSRAGAYTSGQFLTGSNANNNNYGSVAVGPGGTFYGAWKEVHAIKIATFNGTIWTEVPTASFTGAQVATALADTDLDGIIEIGPDALAVESNGNLHLVFHSGTAAGGSPNRRGLVYGKYSATTQTWAFRKLFIISQAGGFYNVSSGTTCMKLDASNNPHVVFVRSDSTIFNDFLQYAFFNGSVWNVSGTTNAFDAEQLDTSSVANQNLSNSEIAFDSSGNLHCAYTKDSSTNQPDIWYIKRTGTTWGAPVLAADVNNATGAALVVDAAGIVSIVDRTTSVADVNYRVTTNATGSFVTSTATSFTYPGAATITASKVVMKINSAGRRIIYGALKGNSAISTQMHLAYETAPGVWAHEAAHTDLGTLTLGFPSLTVRNTDNTVMGLFSRQIISPDTRNLYFATGNPTGYTGGAPVAVAPTVTTDTQTSVTHNSATLGGNVTADGGATVTDRGIVWSTSANPTTADTKVANGSGTGVFSATVTGLPSNTLIHVRAYATNSVNTSYGTDISFTTLPAAAVVSLTHSLGAVQSAAFVFWNITFSSPVNNISPSNFTLSGAAAAGSGVLPPGTSNGGLTWNIPVSTGSTDGTLTLNLANSTGLSSAISTTLPFAGDSITMDKTPPTVLSVVRQTPTGQTTNLTTVTFRVTYSEPVNITAPAANRYQVVPVNGSNIVGTVQSVSGADGTNTRDVTVNITSGTGEFRLRVID